MLKNILVLFIGFIFSLNAFAIDSNKTEITLIRNATVKITYEGKVFLIDPLFAPKNSYEGFAGTLNSHIRWPKVELPFDIKEILKDVDAVIITHTHEDHIDKVALETIPKDLLIFTQNKKDKEYLQSFGFTNIKIMQENSYLGDVKLSITSGEHASNEVMFYAKEVLGVVSGVIFSSKNSKTIYLAGDTVFNKNVEDVVKKYNPDIIILNSGDAKLANNASILMSKEEVLKTHNISSTSKIIAVHMEAVNHATLTRDELKSFVKEKKIEDFIIIPKDGESIRF
ncbi:hypothetical protein AN286_06540 [Aliarcobacter cryaerophilus ATCC 43158]|uniref:Beta-lactamase family protein n=1 Tax=Aliarcobacter cryaerophilus ATCC 43158 TaxID=1032070 RepID=A0AAD0X8L9_9BACT|nr:MBL fold metallo-hydrolase [Aliarcobacter cryaerophilus]AYJ79824.1 beta-lactamase family protein [Aliarcobacter cryaerophilus ATCC 43158]PRM96955.1 hypothetical protein CJ667_07040 [Aliarcobacter cryaerophilus]QCZ24060.1 hypothetical protein AN286_06540 [Aliarcobacter cryaerophilus ATCC 43158]